ncbi:MAG: hypothetical protein JW730_19910 [Anaerolineales bacterium]|nr:hypothetical protein [Anaerolineales bacterium]
MEFNWSIVGWIAGLVFVYLFGIWEGRGQGYKKRKKEEQTEKKDQLPPEPQIVTETVKVDDPGLLRVKNEYGAFTLDLDGARVNPASLLPEQRKRLIEVLGIMRPWLEGKPAPAPSVTTSAAPPSALPVQTPPTAVPVQPASPPPPVSPQPPDSTQGSPAASKPATIAKEDRPVAPAGSIVNQIDTILQARLAGTPLEERGVFLAESPQGGVNVFVGLTRYSGVDEVPDPEIKAAIRAAITEWENKFTPGL